MKIIKTILTIALVLVSLENGFAQVQTNGTVNPSITAENPFFDASSFFDSSVDPTNSGKGLVFPRTDLTTWTFKTDLLDGISFPTAFDGMIVYNSTTGNTLPGQGVVTAVTPGYYYFSNPTGSTDITAGQWLPLGLGANTDTQDLSLVGSVLSLVDGGNVDLTTVLATAGTDNQNIDVLSLAGNVLTVGIENGSDLSVNLGSIDTNTDTQDLSMIGTQIFLTDGGSVDIASATAVPDATIINKGIVQLAGDLTGTAVLPRVANDAITTDKILDLTIGTLDIAANAVTVAKLPTGATATTYLRGDGTWVNPTATSAITKKTANYTVLVTDHTILCDATAGGFTITLPAAASSSGVEYVIKKTDDTANVLTFSTALKLSETVSFTTLNYSAAFHIQSDGTNWWVIN